MKRVVLVLVLIALTSPAIGEVAITITDLGNQLAEISYSADANVSSFGLDITVDAGTIDDINGYFVGECNDTNRGFGLFPANFARYIELNGEESPNWVEPGYTPVAHGSDKGAQGGLGTTGITIELGALYADGNQPGLSGVLCNLQVSEGCDMSVAVNATRCGQTGGAQDAGVVMEDGTAVVPNLTAAIGVAIAASGPYYATCRGDWDGDGVVEWNDDLMVQLGKHNAAYVLCGGRDYNEVDATAHVACEYRQVGDYDGDLTIEWNDDLMAILGRLNMAYVLSGFTTREYNCCQSPIDPTGGPSGYPGDSCD